MAGVVAVLVHAAPCSDSGFRAAARDLLEQRLTEDMIAETELWACKTARPQLSFSDHASVSRCPRRSPAAVPKPASESASGRVDQDRQDTGQVGTAAVGLSQQLPTREDLARAR